MLAVKKINRDRGTVVALLRARQAADEISAATHTPAPIVAAQLAAGYRLYSAGYDYDPVTRHPYNAEAR